MTEHLLTYLALIWLFTGVRSGVSRQRRLGGKSSLAKGTLVRLLSSVYTPMNLERRTIRKLPPTVAAGVRLLPCMSSHVLFHIHT